jgi:predicted DNA-binding transcriptional regulator AlpA
MPNKRYATRDGEGFSALEAKKAEPVESAAKSPGEPNGLERLLTPKETADLLRRSESWLAKRRMRGVGPPFTKIGRSVGYLPSGVVRWLKSRQRSSTSE